QPLRLNPKFAGEDKSEVLLMPWAGTSAWKDKVAEVDYGSFRIRLDTEKLAVSVEDVPPVKGQPLVVQAHVFAKTGTKVRVIMESKADLVLRLELTAPGKEPQQLKKAQKDRFVLSPSPDGNWLAIRRIEDPDQVLLVDRQGVVKTI